MDAYDRPFTESQVAERRDIGTRPTTHEASVSAGWLRPVDGVGVDTKGRMST
jgi:hypothetical protein